MRAQSLLFVAIVVWSAVGAACSAASGSDLHRKPSRSKGQSHPSTRVPEFKDIYQDVVLIPSIPERQKS